MGTKELSKNYVLFLVPENVFPLRRLSAFEQLAQLGYTKLRMYKTTTTREAGNEADRMGQMIITF